VAEVRERIRTMIVEGHVLHGGRLPGERELAAQLHVSRWTVRTALDDLVGSGEIRREAGRGGGTFATTPHTSWPLVADAFEHQYGRRIDRAVGGAGTTTLSLPAILRAQGFAVETRHVRLGSEAATADLAARLGVERGSELLRIDRTRYADGSPVSAESMWLRPERFPGLSVDDAAGSLWDVFVTRYGVTFGPISEEIDIALADRELAAMLAVSAGQPLLRVRRVALDRARVPVEYSVDYFRGDTVRLVVVTNIDALG